MSLIQPDLFTAAPDLPEGLLYRPEVVSPEEELRLIAAFGALPFKPFEFHGYLGNRRVVPFGWRYDYSRRAVAPAEPIPGFLMPLRDLAADIAGLSAADLRQALVTEYAPGAGIGWHRDKPMFEEVVGMSLLSPCTLRFRRAAGAGWERRSIEAQARSAYVMRGPARWEWEHSIPAVREPRYSVTFRRYRPESG